MDLKFKYQTKPVDVWQVFMYNVYSSFTGIVNVMCIISSFILLVSLWKTAPDWMKYVLLLFCALFTVIQPLVLYGRAKKQLTENNPEVEISFDNKGIHIESEGKAQSKKWNDVFYAIVKPTLIIIYTDNQHGYIISNRVTGSSRNELVKILKDNMKNRVKGGK